MRLFVGITLPEDVRTAIAQCGASAIPVRPVPNRWLVRPENLHVTIKFLGEVSESRVPDLCAGLQDRVTALPLWLAADRIECLPERGPLRIISASITGEIDRLHQLHQSIEVACEESGVPRERRPFKPHVTFARIRPPLRAGERAGIESTLLNPKATRLFEVSNVVVFQSHLGPSGARYVPLARFPS